MSEMGVRIVVFYGGTSPEREVSLGSGRAVARALARSFPTRLVRIDADALPAGLDPARDVVCSTLHGGFGESGGMQALLEEAGGAYSGCDVAGSALALDKAATKAAAAGAGVAGARAMRFRGEAVPAAAGVIAELGEDVVVKPNDEGSSVGLSIVSGEAALAEVLGGITRGNWLIEERLRGRELSVGMLGGRALGVVEIRPASGVYDYASKYTPGATEYLAPAPMSEEATAAVRAAAEKTYAACGCRDYARIDFINTAERGLFLLEINTLPGMKEMSLLPKSARCAGLDFTALVKEMVQPAVQRLRAGQTPGSKTL
jgi:D-alanine-D-alanine ligase